MTKKEKTHLMIQNSIYSQNVVVVPESVTDKKTEISVTNNDYYYGANPSLADVNEARLMFTALSEEATRKYLSDGEWIQMYDSHGELIAEASSVIYENRNATKSEIDTVEKIVGSLKNKKVLDLCCGMGRHTLEMAARGAEVDGIDHSKSWIQKAREKAGGEKVKFHKGDARHLRINRLNGSSYDCVTILGNSLGYFKDDENLKIIKGAKRLLKPGGKIIVQLPNKEHALNTLSPKLSKEVVSKHFGNINYLRYRRYNQKTKRLETIRIHTTNEGSVIMNQPLSYRLYETNEITKIGSSAGFLKANRFITSENVIRDKEIAGSLLSTDWYVFEK